MDNLRDGLPYPYTKQDAEEYITAMRQADKSETFAFAITADGRVIGSIGIFRCSNLHSRTAEMGYYIGEPFAYNTASCRVLEKPDTNWKGFFAATRSKMVRCRI